MEPVVIVSQVILPPNVRAEMDAQITMGFIGCAQANGKQIDGAESVMRMSVRQLGNWLFNHCVIAGCGFTDEESGKRIPDFSFIPSPFISIQIGNGLRARQMSPQELLTEFVHALARQSINPLFQAIDIERAEQALASLSHGDQIIKDC